MPISFDSSTGHITIDTDHTTYQMKIDAFGYLLHVYYGARTEGAMDYLITYMDRSGMCTSPHDVHDRTYSLDVLPQEFPFQGTGDMRSPLVQVRDARGCFGCDLRYRTHSIERGKYALPGLPAVYSEDAVQDDAMTLTVRLADERLGIEIELLYGVLPHLDIITRAARLTNHGSEQVVVERLQSACLDFVHGDFDVITFNGRHAMERRPDRHRVGHGSFAVGSRRGMSSNQYNPLMILCDHDATERAGRAWAMSFVYSGGFDAEVECDQYEQVRMQMGLSDDRFSYPLAPGESLVAPEVIMTFAAHGLEELSHSLHRCIRRHVCRGYWRDRARPVLLNSWEAAYFDFDGDHLVRLAEKAASLGIEMLVMDDGWFGNRIDDYRSLGDWRVNEEKLGCTLGELVERVNALGLKFGIWVEPEMISEDSDLYRAHPDWVLAIPGKAPVLGRDQLVLDLSREEVRENLFGQLCAVLDQANIEYVKWDYNRSIVDVYSAVARDQGRVLYDYMIGLYDLLERLTSRYPKILFEGCSAGGGRFDAGMLYYTPQIWTSDNTDADNRMTIQYGTSFGYPASTMGAHVSACPNETNGRDVPISARGVVAMAGGGFGYELDLLELPERACDHIRRQVALYHDIEGLVREGRYYRLSSPVRDRVCAWEFVAEDGSEAVVAAVVLKMEGYGETFYVVPRGLTPGAVYRELTSEMEYPASALMDMGFPLSTNKTPYANRLLHFVRVDGDEIDVLTRDLVAIEGENMQEDAMRSCEGVAALAAYALRRDLIGEEDVVWAVNRALEVLKLEPEGDFEPLALVSVALEEPEMALEDILRTLLDDAQARGVCEEGVTSRDLLDTRLMGVFTPRPSTVVRTFWERYEQAPERATDYLYQLAQDSDYIRTYRIARDRKWVTPTRWGDLDITINLSKPEKDPRAIAAALERSEGSDPYPRCQLCCENEGYAGRLDHPARQTIRLVPLTLAGEPWYLQYSPYVYYHEHCIVLSRAHVPMKIERKTFERLLEFVAMFPHYTLGSNADLPIVGGSILTHEHYQGGRYNFAMARAQIAHPLSFAGFDDVDARMVDWPLSVIRLDADDPSRLVELASAILEAWRGYSDPSVGVLAQTEGVPHNTITPIARRRGARFELDLVLRNNRTSAAHPLGIFHPHEELHHIKKENIGLIEVMGLAVLPARLAHEMDRLAEVILAGEDPARVPELASHVLWAQEVLARHPEFAPGALRGLDSAARDKAARQLDEVIRAEIGAVFSQVLEQCAVFAHDDGGRAAFMRFCHEV